MDRDELRAVQKPLKDQYRADGAAARVVLRAEGSLSYDNVACSRWRTSPH